MACGCIVFSSLNHALSDILTPGEIGHQIGCGSLSNDVDRITAALLDPVTWKPSRSKLDFILHELSEKSQAIRWQIVIDEIDKLLPALSKSSSINQRPQYEIIFEKLLNKFKYCAKRFTSSNFQ